MNHCLRLAWALLAFCLGTACASTRTERASSHAARPLTPALSPDGGKGDASRRARAGDLQSPPHTAAEQLSSDCKSPARRFQKWNPLWWLGNVDDPVPPDWYRPGSPHRRWLWQLRNPLHNFTFYVIGIADQPFTRTGKFPDAVFAPDGGWNWAVARHKWVRLPFVSFAGKWCQCYAGWRTRGNFGLKVNFGKLPAPDPKPQTPDAPTK